MGEQLAQVPISYVQQAQEIQSLISYLDPRKSIEELEHYLKGEIRDFTQSTPDRLAWIKRDGFQKMNDLGVNIVLGKLQAICNPNTIMSELTIKQISDIMEIVTKDITMLLALRYREFEIDKRELYSITMMVLQTIFFVLQRAKEGSAQELMTRLFQVAERVEGIISSQAPQQKRFDPLGWLKGG